MPLRIVVAAVIRKSSPHFPHVVVKITHCVGCPVVDVDVFTHSLECVDSILVENGFRADDVIGNFTRLPSK